MIKISLSECLLELFDKEGKLIKSIPISWSKYGTGFEMGSKKTPTGRFRICEKIGAGEPSGMVFKGRVPTGEIVQPRTRDKEDEGLVLTRILWLDGVDEQNKNTKDRHIYIHGTINEHRIPNASTEGCIVMRNDDIFHLFDLVEVGEEVVISLE